MRKNIFKILTSCTFTIIIGCSGSGLGPAPTTCVDLTYDGLLFDPVGNTISFSQNTTGNLNTATFSPLTGITNPFSSIGNVKGVYDNVNDRYFFLNENDNTNRYLLVQDVSLSSVNIISGSLVAATNTISGSSEFTGAVSVAGRLFVTEIDVTSNTFWISEIDPVLGANLGVIFTDNLSNFDPTNVDSFGIRYYADTNRVDEIYLLGKDLLLEINISNSTNQYYNLPSSFRYFDVEVDLNGFLLSVQIDNAGQVNLVSWDLSSPPSISETIIIQNLGFQSESISLVYKNCDEILHVLNHQANNIISPNTTTIYEYDLLNQTLVTSRVFPDFIFGYAHLEL